MAARPPDRWDPLKDGAYSEWLGFYLVGQILEQSTGVPLRDALKTGLLEPLGIDDVFLGLGGDDLQRIGVNVDLRAGRPVPLLMERAAWFAGGTDPSLNAFATMSGLGRFYEWVLATLDGRRSDPVAPERLRDACHPHRQVVHDQTLGFEASWGLGFMTGLGRLGFGPYVSERAIGHTGQVGTSIAFADPDHELAVAILYNGVIDQPTGMALRRPAIVNDIYQDLGLERRN
jgi:CubicO group peptidase (beta-lactamase class C family)